MPASKRVLSADVALIVYLLASLLLVNLLLASLAGAQSSGNSGSICGIVVDSTGAVVPKAVVHIHNPGSGLERSTSSDGDGKFQFPNIPFNAYHLTVSAGGWIKD